MQVSICFILLLSRNLIDKNPPKQNKNARVLDLKNVSRLMIQLVDFQGAALNVNLYCRFQIWDFIYFSFRYIFSIYEYKHNNNCITLNMRLILNTF